MTTRSIAPTVLLLASSVLAQHPAVVKSAEELRQLPADTRSVKLWRLPLSDAGSLTRLAGLETLEIVSPQPLGDQDCRHISGLPALRELRIEGSRIGKQGLTFLSRLPRLERLWLRNAAESVDAYKPLSEFAALRELRLNEDLHGERRAILDHVARLSRLRSLSLCDNETLDSAGARKLAKLTELRHLDLSRCNGLSRLSGVRAHDPRCDQVGVDDEALCALEPLVKLETLRLADCYSITGRGLGIVAGMRGLRALDVSGCSQVPDDGFGALPTALRELRAQGTAIPGAALARLKHLEVLTLAWVTKLTDEELAVLKDRPLRQVDLTYCKALTADALETIATWKDVEDLNLFGARWLRDEHFATLGILDRLRRLSVGGNLGYSDAGLVQLETLKKLAFLDIRACKKLTTEGLGKLRPLPLRELWLSGCDGIDQAKARSWFPKAKLQ